MKKTRPLGSACLSVLLLGRLAVSAAPAPGAGPIRNVVVMMLENRAFDHLLGYYGKNVDTRVDGLTGAECNARNLSDAAAGRVCVNDGAQDVCAYDPNHSFASTTERIFGCHYGVSAGTPCVDMKMTNGSNDMSGFVESARRLGKDGENEMSMWPPEKVPIMTTLAQEFALFDRFFCSHPGSTYPNRQFVLSATAHGMTDTGNKVPKGGFPQKTVLRSLEAANLTWRMHYEDTLAWAIFLSDVQRPEAKPHLQHMEAFYADAANGTLANFTFLEPRISPNPAVANSSRTFGLANHQHPVASVREGERWMKDVYEALRASPQWNETLLLITYDEHGGFYDHVPPPQEGVPSPDGICTKEGFNYERLGVRVPTLAVSPWIARNTLVHEAPAAQKPAPATSQYELSSIPATLRKIFPALGAPLTARDAWAATFEHLWTGKDNAGTTNADYSGEGADDAKQSWPRTDCPLTLPSVPPPPRGEMARTLAVALDEHALGLMATLCGMAESRAEAAAEVATAAEAAHVGGAASGAEKDAAAAAALLQRLCGDEARAKVVTYKEFAPWATRVWEALGPWGAE